MAGSSPSDPDPMKMSDVPEHFFRQSAVLPFRVHEGRLEILLITSRRKRRWVIPKGVQEPHLTPRESAAKEALEEAGIEGDLAEDSIGSYEYRKWGGTCEVLVYPMAVRAFHGQWLESHRDRVWLEPAAAAARIEEPALRRLIREFARSWLLGPRVGNSTAR